MDLQINKKVVFAMTLNMCLGSLYFGCNISTYNSAIEALLTLNKWRNTDQETLYTALITSSLAAGCILSAPIAVKVLKLFNDNLRRASMILDLATVVAFLIQVVDSNIVNLIIGRFCAGLIIGLNCTYVSSYISDISPINMRGVTGCMNQLFVCSGICITFIVGLLIPSESELVENPEYDDNTSWRIVVGFPVIFTLLRFMILLFIFNFDNPSRLVRDKKENDLNKFLNLIYKDEQSKTQVYNYFKETFKKSSTSTKLKEDSDIKRIESSPDGMEVTCSQQQDQEKNSNNQISSHESQRSIEDMLSYKKRWILCFLMCIGQQLTCINGVMFYSNQILKDSKENARYYTIGLGLTQVFFTLCGAFLSEKVGRRPLMLWGTLSMAISLELIGIFLQIQNFVLSFLSVAAFLIGFSLSQGPLVWAYLGEVLDEKGLQINTAVLWLFTLIIGICFPFLAENLDKILTFSIFAIITSLFLIYFFKEFIETKGKSKTQIYKEFCEKSSSQSSVGCFMNKQDEFQVAVVKESS